MFAFLLRNMGDSERIIAAIDANANKYSLLIIISGSRMIKRILSIRDINVFILSFFINCHKFAIVD